MLHMAVLDSATRTSAIRSTDPIAQRIRALQHGYIPGRKVPPRESKARWPLAERRRRGLQIRRLAEGLEPKISDYKSGPPQTGRSRKSTSFVMTGSLDALPWGGSAGSRTAPSKLKRSEGSGWCLSHQLNANRRRERIAARSSYARFTPVDSCDVCVPGRSAKRRRIHRRNDA
jgi:hypothetical protein